MRINGKHRWGQRPYQKDRYYGADYIAAMLAIGGFLDECGRCTTDVRRLPYCFGAIGQLPAVFALGLTGHEQAELIEHLESITDGM